jgi:hypothetical protein
MGGCARSGNSGAVKSAVAALYERRCILAPAVTDRRYRSSDRRGSRVGCLEKMQTERLPLQRPRFSDALFQCDRFLRLLHDLVKARIVAQRIPPGMQPQLAVGNRTVERHELFELLDRKILFADPRVNDREVS